jgi:hypothetical protein
MRSALDMAMMRICRKYRVQGLSEDDRKRFERNVYFPICDDRSDFDKRLKMLVPGVANTVPALYALLLQIQPFETRQKTVAQLRDLANLGKHVQLARQTRGSQPATRFTAPDGRVAAFTHGSGFAGTSWGDIPINPLTREPAPLAALKEEFTWVTFSIPDYGIIEPAVFCFLLQSGLSRYIPKLLVYV